MQRAALGFRIALSMVFVGVVNAQDDGKIGLHVGARVAAYIVHDVTGPNAGKTYCYRCQFGNQPVVNVLARQLDDATGTLIKQLDRQLAVQKDIKGFVTLLTEDAEEAEKQLRDFAAREGIKHLPLTIYEGAAGPPEYKLARDAEVTVLMWTQSKVRFIDAFPVGKLTDRSIEKIIKQLAALKS